MISSAELQDSRSPTPVSRTYETIKGDYTISQQAIQDPEIAARYWKKLFSSLKTQQPQLRSFPLGHRWPRYETMIGVTDRLYQNTLDFSTQYDIRLDDLLYAI